MTDEVAVVLADGTSILKNGRRLVPVPQSAAKFSQEIQSGRQAVKALERMHRKLGDLPSDDPKKLNPIAAIITYTAIGLDDAAIAVTLGATEDQIRTLKESDIFKQLFELFDQTVFEDAKRNAKHIIARAADKAANRIVEAVDSDDPGVRLAASRDVMKFNGISTDAIDNRKIAGLHIKITRRNDAKEDEDISISVEQ